jgi:hypothetical protein
LNEEVPGFTGSFRMRFYRVKSLFSGSLGREESQKNQIGERSNGKIL